ncbi:phospholipase D family nuclease [Ancylobacter terrae]|uniref:phospholipase D family nuclease n=1 Tax=Ancylobacter sp. sgz301288 TaxID=3342077 RepID=UPI003859ADFC
MASRLWLAALGAAIVAGSAAAAPLHGPTQAQVAVCFVPEQECSDDIVAAIDGAQKTIRVQAYGFSAPPILKALAAARQRGVDVEIVLDKSDADRERKPRFAAALAMQKAGIPVWIDDRPHTAHNKLIIIDDREVIGGSYNYTRTSDHKNVENVTFITSPEVAGWYGANWQGRRELSRPFDPGAGPQ